MEDTVLMPVPIVFEHQFEHATVTAWPDEQMYCVVHVTHRPRIAVGMHDVVNPYAMATG